MIYANVANAINGFGSGGEDYQASILATVYNNATSLTIGNTTVGWDYNDVNNGTFLNNLTEQQLAVLVFDACSRIFQSYNLVVPAEFTDLLDQLADGQVPPEQGVYEFLLESLAYRFYVSAVYYVVACVSFFELTRLMSGITFTLRCGNATRSTVAQRSNGLDRDIYSIYSRGRVRRLDRDLADGLWSNVSRFGHAVAYLGYYPCRSRFG